MLPATKENSKVLTDLLEPLRDELKTDRDVQDFISAMNVLEVSRGWLILKKILDNERRKNIEAMKNASVDKLYLFQADLVMHDFFSNLPNTIKETIINYQQQPIEKEEFGSVDEKMYGMALKRANKG